MYLHLPVVTYDGEISFGNHVFGIYGSTEGDAVTTFTGTVSMRGLKGNYADLSGIRFAGESGIGLNAYCLVLLFNCSFDGWDTAAVAQNGAWISADTCTFTNNGTALKFLYKRFLWHSTFVSEQYVYRKWYGGLHRQPARK